MAIRKPYKIHRQMHLGDMLDELESRGSLKWTWQYVAGRAYYWIERDGLPRDRFDTRRAEGLVQQITNALQIVWIPVPHHGSEDRWLETIEKMDKMKSGELPKPWEAAVS